jgi:hypothetical protein
MSKARGKTRSMSDSASEQSNKVVAGLPTQIFRGGLAQLR